MLLYPLPSTASLYSQLQHVLTAADCNRSEEIQEQEPCLAWTQVSEEEGRIGPA